MQSTNKFKIYYYWLPVIFFLFNLILKLQFISADDISIDEPITLSLAFKNIPALFSALHFDNSPPLYYLFMHYWTFIFGDGPFISRLPSVLFASASATVIYLIGLRYLNFRTAVFATIIYSASNVHIYYSHDARVYALFFLLTTLSTFFYLQFSLTGKKYSLLFVFIINVLLTYSHFFGFVVISLQAFCLLIIPSLRHHFKKYLLSVAGVIIFYSVYLPVLIYRFNNCIAGTGIQKPLFSDLYTMLWRFSNAPLVTVIFLVILLIGLIFYFLNKNHSLTIRIFIISFLTGYFTLFAISFWLPVFIDRYLIFTSLYYYLLIGVAIDILLPQSKKGFYITCLIPLIVFCSTKLFSSKKRDVGKMVNYIKSNQSERAIILIAPEWFDLNFLYYYNHDWFKNLHYADSLHNNSIFRINNSIQLNTINYFSASTIFYIDAGSEITDPDHKIFQSLSNSFPDYSQQAFTGHMTVYRFSKRSSF